MLYSYINDVILPVIHVRMSYFGAYSQVYMYITSRRVKVHPTPLHCSFAADEIHFNLLAIVSDRKKMYKKEILELEQRKELAAQRVGLMHSSHYL